MNSFDDLFEAIANAFLFMLLVASILSFFSVGRSMDGALTDTIQKKSTVVYTLAYGKEDRYISAQAVLSDIIATTNETVKINGNKLSEEGLVKLRSYDNLALQNIKNDLGNKEYKKVLTFNEEGYVIEINFVERR